MPAGFLLLRVPYFLASMDLTLALKALIMGFVEGFTEFLPISSTGHLILMGSLLNFTGEKVKVFEVSIQLGALLAVFWEYRVRLKGVTTGFLTRPRERRFAINIVVGSLPAILLGLLFAKQIKEELFSPLPVAMAFIAGGLVMLWAERMQKTRPEMVRIHSVDELTVRDAFKVGCAQAAALIPGTSRSGASIIGGLIFGMSRTASTEFSFFLAIPMLTGATVYSLYKASDILSIDDLSMFLVGGTSAFVSAFLCVRWLLRYISQHDFSVFAWYRIAFGFFIIISAYFGWVEWVE
jgi:undecaprenyl-diphosphatase